MNFSLAFSVSTLGPKSYQKLLNEFGSAEKAWLGSKLRFEKIGIVGLIYDKFDKFRNKYDGDSYEKKLKKEKIKFISQLDKNYPEGLRLLPDPPIGLFLKGNSYLLNKDNITRVAVVGTRKITSYGRAVTESVVTGLSLNNICIVSGLALGVDAVAHRTSIDNNNPTIVVLGCGTDCCLPSENYSLYRLILEKSGLIVSEYPLSQPPNKGTFLARNRIIAAISEGVLITEAAMGSGSLVTAQWGLKLDKKVFAIPGPITSRMSDGSLELLKKGAHLVSEARDILEVLAVDSGKLLVIKQYDKKLFTENENLVIDLINNEGLSIDEISKKLNIPVTRLFSDISGLELRGIIENDRGKWRVVGL